MIRQRNGGKFARASPHCNPQSRHLGSIHKNKVHIADLREKRLTPLSLTTRASLSGSQSVDRALGLLSLIGREPAEGLALSEIVAGSRLNKPTVRRLLLALMRAGLVEQEAQ